MILRKLARGIQRQDWFTVVIEVAIVVVGIFIGLQVDDWNENRKARSQEILYLQRIIDDLVISIDETDYDIDFQKKHAGRAVVVMDALQACEIPADARRDFANGLYHLGKISPAQFARMTIDELRSSGEFTVLRNAQLRRQISEVVQHYEDGRAIISDIRGRLAPQINYVESHVALRIRGPIGGGAEIDWQDVDMDFQALCRDRRFFNAISAAVNYTWDVVASNTRLVGEMQSLKSELESELGSLRGPSP